MVEILSQSRRAALKQSFATRRVPLDAIAGVETAAASLKPGDVVVAEVLEIGHHTKIETPNGRRAALYRGDEILVACGARYAPDQFEADAPTANGPAHLVAAGGIAGIVSQAHERMAPATSLRILGAAVNAAGAHLHLSDFALREAFDDGALPVIAVVGTSMNAGKTHSVTSIVRGLRAGGLRVAAIKVTGTGAGGDLWRQIDAGAEVTMDFTDVGFATTFRENPAALEAGARRMIAAAAQAGVDVAVMEIADGLRQGETAALLKSETLGCRIDGIVFAAGDAMGAERGVEELQNLGHRVLAVSGLLTRSPLAIREASRIIRPPVLNAEALSDPQILKSLMRTRRTCPLARRLANGAAPTRPAPSATSAQEVANVA